MKTVPQIIMAQEKISQSLETVVKTYRAVFERAGKSGAKIKPVELELRAAITSDVYQQIYEKLDKSEIVIEQSLVLLHNEESTTQVQSTLRHMIVYAGSKATKSTMRKTSIMRADLAHNFRAALAFEDPLPVATQVPPPYRMRFRHRVSCRWTPEWQLDLTLVWELENNMVREAPRLRDEFFNDERRGLFPTKWPKPSIGIYTYEVEVEYVGRPAELTTEALRKQFDKLQRYASPGTIDREYNSNISKLAARINDKYVRPTLKEISNNPRIFTLAEYAEKIYPDLQSSQIYVCEKTDGERAWIVARDRQIWVVTGTAYELQDAAAPADVDCVLDAEYVGGKYYAFDCMLSASIPTVDLGYADRLKKCAAECKALGKVFPVLAKTMHVTTIDKFSEVVKTLLAAKHQTAIDGVIFTRGDSTYYQNMYKLKPQSHQTADFLIISAAPLLGIEPWLPKPGHELYILFCTGNRASTNQFNIEKIRSYNELLRGIPYSAETYPIQFVHETNPLAYLYYAPARKGAATHSNLHGHVGEFLYQNGGWELQRMRPDRDIGVRQGTGYGNSLHIATITYVNTIHPILPEHLSAPGPAPGGSQVYSTIAKRGQDVPKSYFSKDKADNVKAPVKYNAWVKAMIQRQFSGSTWLLDLCCGQGQDMFVFSGYGVQNLVMVDRDAAALQTLADRMPALLDAGYYKYSPRPRQIPTIFRYTVDLQKVLDGAKPPMGAHADRKYNVIVMNFAIHYFCSTTENIEALLDFVYARLEPGGIFLFTAFGGKQVRHLLGAAPNGAASKAKGAAATSKDVSASGIWQVQEAGATKYRITAKYDTAAPLQPAGQLISVRLPFADDERDEYLVNQEYIIDRMRSRGCQLRQNASFGNWFGHFAGSGDANRALLQSMSDDDKRFCSLYQYTALYKA